MSLGVQIFRVDIIHFVHKFSSIQRLSLQKQMGYAKLKVPITVAAGGILFIFFFFFFVFFRENKAWHFMWIVCYADNSLEMPSLIIAEKELKKLECCLPQFYPVV